jgi:hypothetical protein
MADLTAADFQVHNPADADSVEAGPVTLDTVSVVSPIADIDERRLRRGRAEAAGDATLNHNRSARLRIQEGPRQRRNGTQARTQIAMK